MGHGNYSFLIVLVAALNIVNPLTMMVIEKTREIGILKAMGSTDKSITLSLYIRWDVHWNVIGIIVGLLGGFVLCEIIARVPIPMPGGGMVYYIDRLPVKVEPSSLLWGDPFRVGRSLFFCNPLPGPPGG